MGHNELLLREALQAGGRDQVQISVKFGAMRGPERQWGGMDTRPAAVKNFVAYSLKRLGVDHIDIYRPARLDPNVPIEDTVGAIAELIKAGHVRHIGLSEVGSDTLRRAHAVHPIADLQIEYSMISRGIESGILQTCRELGIGITAYGVLSRGLISGHWSKQREGEADFRGLASPRFQGANLDHNLALVEKCAPSPTSWAYRWRRWRSPGWRRRARTSSRWSARAPATACEEALGAPRCELSAADLAQAGAGGAGRCGGRRPL
jgi:aryl-alcohol dehydrogenase-like predicted oxidoreductase